MPQYRYRPADNRTPVADPVFGGLHYDGVYTDERCAEDPRFELIPEGGEPGFAQGGIVPPPADVEPPAEPDPEPDHVPDTDPPAEPDTVEPADETPPASAEQADADQLGQE